MMPCMLFVPLTLVGAFGCTTGYRLLIRDLRKATRSVVNAGFGRLCIFGPAKVQDIVTITSPSFSSRLKDTEPQV